MFKIFYASIPKSKKLKDQELNTNKHIIVSTHIPPALAFPSVTSSISSTIMCSNGRKPLCIVYPTSDNPAAFIPLEKGYRKMLNE
jgi:hypothetical protein